MAGYIKLYRGWRDTDGLLPSNKFSDFEAWLWLLENCAWKAASRWNAKGEEIRLEPGQIHVSIRSLTTAWGWSRKAVTTFLTRLERVQKVRLSKGQSGTVLTICNWCKYQAQGDGEGDSQGASKGTAGGQPGDTHKEGKEGKEDNYDCASNEADFSFDDFVETWNEVAAECGLQAIKRKTEPRRRAFKVRQREYPDIDDWKAAFRCLQTNKWMHGDNKTGWRADPDFFLQAKSFTKLVEGQYGQAER